MNNKLILIAGGSCSGKSTIAQRLVDTSGIQALHFGLDSYYRDARGVPDHEIEVDIPDALDHELIIDHVQQLVAGKAIDQPVYDYASHSRLAATNRVEPAPLIVVEGLFALYWEPLRDIAVVTAYVDAPADECLRRRIARDAIERGRSEEATRQQFAEKVLPNYQRYVHPTREHASVVLSGVATVGDAVLRLASLI